MVRELSAEGAVLISITQSTIRSVLKLLLLSFETMDRLVLRGSKHSASPVDLCRKLQDPLIRIDDRATTHRRSAAREN